MPAKQRLRINAYRKTNHCKSTKCQTEHRASNRIRETPLEAKCHSSRAYGRNGHDVLEDPAAYEAFERAIKSDYSPQTAIEGQLVTRLASLLWRLRRAVAVESGLLTMQ